ncbi:MAG: ribosome maturation factor RimM [Polyangiaceae bacterium]|nr:ribosome maturation factor RimM [Polyangiaceae bacterium]
MKHAQPDSWIDIADLMRPHGIRGELRAKLHNPDSDVLFSANSVRVRLPTGSERDMPIVFARAASPGVVLIAFEGVGDRNAADALRGAVLSVPRSLLPAPSDNEFYVCDVIGARVVLVDGTPVGEVIDYRSYPTTDVLVIEGDEKRYEVPMIDDFVERVDVGAHSVVLRTIDGFESI